MMKTEALYLTFNEQGKLFIVGKEVVEEDEEIRRGMCGVTGLPCSGCNPGACSFEIDNTEVTECI